LLLIGFTILLAGFPFHIGVRSVVTSGPALVPVLIFGLVHLVVIAFIFTLLSANPWIQQDAEFLQALRWIGVATALLGGILAATALDFGRLLSSLLLIDVAITLLSLTVAGAAGWQTAVSVQIARFFSLLLTAIGLELLRRQGATTAFTTNRGVARCAPLAATLFGFGCASLLGLPLTPGFGSRWAAVQQVTLAQQAPSIAWLPFLLLLATAGGAYGLLRCLAFLLAGSNSEKFVAMVELPWLRGIAVAVLVVSLWLAAVPQTLLAYAYRLADLFG
jgi:formate hydrogenlyase subunit 3/multisubunit Na+/H+ antiporter MnhD subunit